MAYSKEELIAMGFDEATAVEMTKNVSETGAGSPFKKIGMNYSDTITDACNIKKGHFIAGYVEDKKTLTVKEEGVDFGNEIEFYIVSHTFQCSQFDTATNSNVFMTPFYSDHYSTKTQRDKKTGQTVEERKAQNHRVVFNQILLMMVKQADGSFAPYLHYLHGTNYNQWNTQLEANGAVMNLTTLFKIKSKKVSTNFAPAWCFDFVSATDRMADVPKSIKEVSEAIKAFNKWIDSSNAQGSSSTSASTPQASSAVEEDTDDDIAF
jgi:hypothetical protein